MIFAQWNLILGLNHPEDSEIEKYVIIISLSGEVDISVTFMINYGVQIKTAFPTAQTAI